MIAPNLNSPEVYNGRDERKGANTARVEVGPGVWIIRQVHSVCLANGCFTLCRGDMSVLCDRDGEARWFNLAQVSSFEWCI